MAQHTQERDRRVHDRIKEVLFYNKKRTIIAQWDQILNAETTIRFFQEFEKA